MLEGLKRVRSRVPNVALGVIVGLLVGGGAFAVAQTTGGGVHGGPEPRFHDASECNLVDVSTLEGNWTHGDYVSAVEKQNPSKVREAAQSQCGKPVKAGKAQKNGQKQGKSDDEKQGAKPSSKPSAPPGKPTPSASPSATGTASPVVPLETDPPSPTPTAESTSTATP